MKDGATLIQAIAALIGAVAWPSLVLLVLLLFRPEIRDSFKRLSKVKVGSFEADLEAEAAAIVDQAVDRPGVISPEQIRAASRVEIEARAIDDSTLRAQLDRLCLEYERLRQLLPPGRERTRAMTSVLVRMRTLGPACVHMLNELKASPAAGKRLEATAIMQILPDVADLDWLVERFHSEAPFIFYNAAAALRAVAASANPARVAAAVASARKAYDIVTAFSGEPDRGALEVLEDVMALGPAATPPGANSLRAAAPGHQDCRPTSDRSEAV
jgi:hypothetical protein